MISDLTALFLTAIVFGAIGMVSATRFALSALMLTDQQAGWARALGFAVGTTVVFLMATVLGMLGVEVPGAGSPNPTINLVLGIIMVVAAGAMLFMHHRRPADKLLVRRAIRRWRARDWGPALRSSHSAGCWSLPAPAIESARWPGPRPRRSARSP